jgi:hypothetical protein
MSIFTSDIQLCVPKSKLLLSQLEGISELKIKEIAELPERIFIESNGSSYTAYLSMEIKSNLVGDVKPKLPKEVCEIRKTVKSRDEKVPLIEFLAYELDIEFRCKFFSSQDQLHPIYSPINRIYQKADDYREIDTTPKIDWKNQIKGLVFNWGCLFWILFLAICAFLGS